MNLPAAVTENLGMKFFFCSVFPPDVGIQRLWIPACVGMTKKRTRQQFAGNYGLTWQRVSYIC